ncbi:MAG: hypothetical protein JWL91_170 [Sphingomonas bacterium]|nr:hypothetical protein [Sphingomonas bacterium]
MPKDIRSGASYTDDMWRRANAALAHARREEAWFGLMSTNVRGRAGGPAGLKAERDAVPRPMGRPL